MLFYHGDHLGSSNFITDDLGAVYQDLEYFPYGETWVEDGGSGQMPYYRFTGKELDPETGLYYFGARYYDPVLSRWISADPALAKYFNSRINGGIYNPSHLVLYSYALNNPVVYKDPDGNLVPALVIAVAVAYAILTEPTELEKPTSEAEQAVRTVKAVGEGIGLAKSPSIGAAIKQGIERLFRASQEKPKPQKTDNPNTHEPFTPKEALEKKAPKQVEPGTRELEHERINPKTGELEKSKVHYDEYGRQEGRTDYTTHSRPQEHTDPHHHTTEYGPGYATKGKESGPKPGPYPGDQP